MLFTALAIGVIAEEQLSMSRSVHSKLTKVQDKIDDKKYAGALKILKPLRRNPLTDYEAQNVLNYIGFLNYMLEDYPASIDAYEDLLKIRTIDDAIRQQTIYTIAQLHTTRKDHENAIRVLEDWFDQVEDPPAAGYALYAHNLMQLNRYEEMIEPIETAIRLATERDEEIKANWYEMINFALLQQAQRQVDSNQYTEALATLQDLRVRENHTTDEMLNVLTKTGFVYELLGDTGNAIAVYEEALAAPGLNDQGKQQISARVTFLRAPETVAISTMASSTATESTPDVVDTTVTASNAATEAMPEPAPVATEIIKTTPIRLIEERYALVIGNSAYRNIDPLDNPKNDVRLVSAALESAGFEVTTLLDGDFQTMDEVVNKFTLDLDGAGDNAVGIFYYAGHGVSYQGQNWLIPVNSNIQQATHLKYKSLSANYVLELMQEARNATDIMILDSCRNSPFRGFSLTGRRGVDQGLARMDIAPIGSYIVYSTAPGRVAYDGSGEYSAFAEAFAYEVETTSESIGDMMIDVRVKVKEATEHEQLGAQIPWANSSLLGRFWFNPGKPGGEANARLLTGE